MIKVGVTGGIGSGKTTLCEEWEKLGAFVVYADDLAKEIMVKDKLLVAKIKSIFGEESYFSDGSLNRSYLAKEAFENNRVDELNKIVHPVLWETTEALALDKEKEGVEVFVKEAAILLQNGRPDNLDVVVLVTANTEQRVNRVVKRDKTKKELVLDRVSKQQNFDDLSDLIDVKISNDGNVKDLRLKARKLFNEIKKI